MLERDSRGFPRHAAEGLLRGGLRPEEVGDAVRRTGARVVHAHNVNPTLGWRALAAAREAGARVVLHLHNYRLVCAVGTCFTQGEDCTRCHGRNTLPGVRLTAAAVRRRSRRPTPPRSRSGRSGSPRRPTVSSSPALSGSGACGGARGAGRRASERAVVGAARVRWRVGRGRRPPRPLRRRLSHEKGVADAVVACRDAGLPLVVAGEGPAAAEPIARCGRRRAVHRES